MKYFFASIFLFAAIATLVIFPLDANAQNQGVCAPGFAEAGCTDLTSCTCNPPPPHPSQDTTTYTYVDSSGNQWCDDDTRCYNGGVANGNILCAPLNSNSGMQPYPSGAPCTQSAFSCSTGWYFCPSGGGSCDNNGTCDAGENNSSCPGDCPGGVVCNDNGVCDAGEDSSCTNDNCPSGGGSACTDTTPGINQMQGCVYNDTHIYNNVYGNAPRGAVSLSPALIHVAIDTISQNMWPINGGPLGLSENFSVQWKGRFNFQAGLYRFSAYADNAKTLTICDQNGNNCTGLMSDWSLNTYSTQILDVNVTAGDHVIIYEYLEGGGNGNSEARLSWARVGPDLTAGAASPTTATAGTPLTFSATITNSGNSSTGAGFNNFFQVASAANGGGTVTDLAPTAMSTLNSGANNTATSPSYTFGSASTYSVRVCADKSNSSSSGSVTEVDENNNCGTWTNVTVSNAPIVGSCGNASGKTYAASATGYAPDVQCAAGTPSNTNFPAQGGTENWTCNAPGGNSGQCSANRSAPVAAVNGVCGSANGRAYANGSSSYAPYVQCSAGTSDNTAFPTAGNSVTWTCLGSGGGGNSLLCSANQDAPIVLPPTYLISLTKGGDGSVTSNPAGINCGNSCTYQSVSFSTGSTVTLTPTAGANRVFAGWGGDCSFAGKNPCTLNMDSNKTVIAIFTINPLYQEF